MDLFNKTFFRFAIGFVAIVAISAAMIIIGNTLHELNMPEGECVNCAGN